MKNRILSTLILSALFGAATAQAATIVPVNRDPDGQGLNDPTALAPVGNNPGTSIGEQRRIVYQFAADLWGAVLKSDVDVRVAASFQPLTCTAASGVLGSAGPYYINRDFEGAPVAGVWYHSALADAIAGENLNAGVEYVAPDDIEIISRFNSNLGTPGCLEASGFYYGLDGKTPVNKINFLDVVMHEIAHGLGFSGFLDKTTGALADFDGTPRSDAYTEFAYDNVENKRFGNAAMTDALRATAMKTPGRLAWDGTLVNAQVPAALGPQMKLTTSGTLSGNFAYGAADFGPPVSTTNFNGAVVLATDGTANGAQACGVLTNAAAIAGKVALVDRGTCVFTVKVKNAENAGATAVLVADNVTGSPPGIGGADPTITIPSVRISLGAGNLIKGALPGVNAAITVVPGRFAGSDAAGRALLYAPTVVAGGSTFSHYDTTLMPNALQEPNISQDLDANFRVDLNPALFQDMGWVLDAGNAKTRGGKCDTGLKVVRDPGFLAGANILAAENLCRTRNPSSSAGFQSCIAPFVTGLKDAGLISPGPNSRLAVCLK